MQASMANEKSTEASIKNLETQMGQLAKQISDQSASTSFSPTTQANPKEHCKAITTRSGRVCDEKRKVVERKKKVVEKDEEVIVEEEVVEKDEEGEVEKNDNVDVEDDLVENEVLVENEKENGVVEKEKVEEKKKKIKKRKEKEVTYPLRSLPYPHLPSKKDDAKHYARFMDIFKQLQINIPFTEALEKMPKYAKFMKDILTKKKRYTDQETIIVDASCSAIIQRTIPKKESDQGRVTLPVTIGDVYVGKGLIDLGSIINLIPLSIVKRLGEIELKSTKMTLQLADKSITRPHGVALDLLVKVDKFFFPVDFVVIDMEEDVDAPLILGRPFMKTARMMIDIDDGLMKVRVQDEEICFNLFEAMKHPMDKKDCFKIDVIEEATQEVNDDDDSRDIEECLEGMEISKEMHPWEEEEESLKKDLKDEDQKLELKELPSHLKYVFLEEGGKKPVIISNTLSENEEESLIEVLKSNKNAIGWVLADLKGISPAYCMHNIMMEDEYKPVAQPQRRLNPVMKDVVRKEVVKMLEAGMTYPISDSTWVSPVHVVPKKGGLTVVSNDKDELVQTRKVTGWRMCIDYRRLNKATRKDHFPLPFMDQMLERLAGQQYYCFLEGYSGYNQISVNPEDHEKTAFTCPFRIFAYRRMPFGLCNAPATFQRCMQAIFADLIEKTIEVFMDDFSVFGASFDLCLKNLDTVLKRCVQTNLVLNWEKCNFMVTEGIVLGHKISSRGIEVDKAKIDVIETLPPPTNVKGIRSFLGHAGFYRRFIKDFSKIAKPLSNLLNKDESFIFDRDCLMAFEKLKENLINAPIITAPNWKLDFELMCDASDYAVGVVLGQRKNKIFHAIHYASKVLNDAQINYATTKKELLAIVYALEKFRPYLIGSKVVVFTDHSAIKYLLTKPDSKQRLIRWILLLQEFDLEVRDKKENPSD